MNYELNIINGMKRDVCIIPVCKCIDGMHGKKFKALMETTARSFNKAHLVLCDSLDAHNMADKNSPLWEEALEASILSADRWMRKHFDIVEEAFGNNITVTRWNDLRTDAQFEARYTLVRDLYETNSDIRDYIHDICSNYVELSAERQYQQGFIADREKMMRRSIEYTLEEIAGTATYNEWFQAPVIYLGAYFEDPEFFNQNNDIAPAISLTLPEWCRVSGEVKAAA